MGHKEELKKAVMTQFTEVDTGEISGQKKKEAVETLDILYKLQMAQEKADQESELKESEMVLKEDQAKWEKQKMETEQKIKELQAELEVKKFEAEQENKKQEAKRERAKMLYDGTKDVVKLGKWCIVAKIWKSSFDSLVVNEKSINVIPQRPFMFLKVIERYALSGLDKFI